MTLVEYDNTYNITCCKCLNILDIDKKHAYVYVMYNGKSGYVCLKCLTVDNIMNLECTIPYKHRHSVVYA